MNSRARVEDENFRFHHRRETLENRRSPATLKLAVARTMKSKELCRDIFGLAVRLLGLYFLYLVLRAVSPWLDLEVIENASRNDIINAILPMAFHLAIAWWLLRGDWLLRRAYPDGPKVPVRSSPPPEQETSGTQSVPGKGLTEMDRAEQKLASLVETPKGPHAP
jgi:hypothetical protein